MWYDSWMHQETMLRAAGKAVERAQGVRKHHSRSTKKGAPQREADIRFALEAISKAMQPIRSELGRAARSKTPVPVDGLREASQAMQRERRKLWKMKKRVK